MGQVDALAHHAAHPVMAERPVINFASGLPDPAGFPVEALR